MKPVILGNLWVLPQSHKYILAMNNKWLSRGQFVIIMPTLTFFKVRCTNYFERELKIRFKISPKTFRFYPIKQKMAQGLWFRLAKGASYLKSLGISEYYYMASTASGQDEPNRPMWLATREGKMEQSCPLRTTRCIPHEKIPRKPYNKSFIDQVCAVKMAGYWPRSNFFASLWTSTSSRSINTQLKELGQYPAVLTSLLVNNPYIWN